LYRWIEQSLELYSQQVAETITAIIKRLLNTCTHPSVSLAPESHKKNTLMFSLWHFGTKNAGPLVDWSATFQIPKWQTLSMKRISEKICMDYCIPLLFFARIVRVSSTPVRHIFAGPCPPRKLMKAVSKVSQRLDPNVSPNLSIIVRPER